MMFDSCPRFVNDEVHRNAPCESKTVTLSITLGNDVGLALCGSKNSILQQWPAILDQLQYHSLLAIITPCTPEVLMLAAQAPLQ